MSTKLETFTEDVGYPHLQLQGSPRLMDSLDTTRLADWIANQDFYYCKWRVDVNRPSLATKVWHSRVCLPTNDGQGVQKVLGMSHPRSGRITPTLIEFELHDGCIQMRMDA